MTENLEVPFLDLPAQYAKIKGEIQAALEDVLQSQRFILGPQVEAFESEMAELCGARFAVSCASGSDALLLALMVAGVRSGDRVVCPTYTFIATAGAIARLGAVPVFTDVSAANANMDGDCVREVLKRHSDIKAIVPVHLFGRLADMNGIRCIAQGALWATE